MLNGNQQTMTIGLYGGSFDPIHFGHITLLETALDQLNFDEIVVMPSGGVAHYKPDSNKAPGTDRIEMIKRAVGENPRITVSTYEIDQGEFVYTIETLRYLRAQYPEGSRIILLVGADWVDKIPTWKKGEQLLKEFELAAFTRPGFQLDQNKLTQQQNTIHLIDMPLMDISSSNIRQDLANSKDVSDKVPLVVLDYINARGLYKN